MAAVPEMVAIARRIRPDMACLVPEKRQELTTEGGLDVTGRQETLAAEVADLKAAGIRVSLFIDADREQIRSAKAVGADYIEIHTGPYLESLNPDSGQGKSSIWVIWEMKRGVSRAVPHP